MASLFSAGCESAYKSVFSDETPETWCWLGYEGNQLVLNSMGKKDLQEMISKVEDNQILYGLLRLAKTDDGGDSKRVKFVFLTWVGEQSSPLKKGKVTVHKKQCATLFKGFHIEKQVYEREALEGLQKEIDESLKRAGGANYDLGNIRTGVQAGNSEALKSESKKFFERKEQESEIRGIVYNKGPLSKNITACDLSNRQFVASHTDALRNIIGYASPSKS